MGCGFSTEDTKASDEERILKSSDVVSATNTTMGGALAKKSPAKKKQRGDNKGRDQGGSSSLKVFLCVSDAQARANYLTWRN